jgi:hypothetical protein
MNQPTRRDRLRPMEYVMLSGFLALFGGAMVLMVTRDVLLALIVAGLVFVVVVIGIAMLMLAVSPNSTPDGERAVPETGND